ncbi:hypothetical protein [Levilactobacillus brevis]|uniref:hypothetical protein n=1 Tax=Levilactobacillus brevis TaxID=1580 RepID=UPI0015DD96B7|nr:hypothetical protein [Levilactobacillus brevis]
MAQKKSPEWQLRTHRKITCIKHFQYEFYTEKGALAMALGGTTAEYDRKFATPVVTHINQTDEEQAILEHNAHVEALETYAMDLQNCLEHTTDEKYKRYLAVKIDCTNQQLEKLRTEE